MFNIAINRPTHGARLERWLGPEQVARLSVGMKNWYGPPIAVSGVPGNVWALPGGDFGGIIKSGNFINAIDFGIMSLKKRLQRYGLSQRQQCNAGFASLSELIQSATTGKRRDFTYFKTFNATSVGQSVSSWMTATLPSAGAAGSAAPGGRACDDATTGGMPFSNPGGGETMHIAYANAQSTVDSVTILLYDRIFDVAKTMSSLAVELVTGVPTRYQSSTATDPDYAGGNFCFPEVFSTLSATAHNWTDCRYRNQAGTDAISFPSIAGSGAGPAAGRIDVSSQWFMTLAAGDHGVMDLNQMQCSASVTGAVNFVIGHPLAWMPCPIANVACVMDGINTSFNLSRIFDDACLGLLNINCPTTSAVNSSGSITACYN